MVKTLVRIVVAVIAQTPDRSNALYIHCIIMYCTLYMYNMYNMFIYSTCTG